MHILKSSALWQLAAGFVLGVLGVVALHPAEAVQTIAAHVAPHSRAAH